MEADYSCTDWRRLRSDPHPTPVAQDQAAAVSNEKITQPTEVKPVKTAEESTAFINKLYNGRLRER